MTVISFAPAVYSLCFLASVTCALLLIRTYLSNKVPLLLWAAVCFVLLALNNFFLVVDLVFLPQEIDLQAVRTLLALASVLTLLYGFIWKVD
jgi:hypothetical protein